MVQRRSVSGMEQSGKGRGQREGCRGFARMNRLEEVNAMVERRGVGGVGEGGKGSPGGRRVV